MLRHEDLRSWYGWAELLPRDPIVAGSMGRWRVIYHVGRYGIAAGGALKLVFRAASDWPAFQGKDPYEESFLTVSTAGRGKLAWRYDVRGYAQPWPRAVTVDVSQYGLAEGDTVTFYLGDPEGGSPGVRAQTFAERNHEFRVVVDPFATGQYVSVPSPTVDIVGGEAARLALTAPSIVRRGEPFALAIRVEDRWGNLAGGYAGQVKLEGLPGLEAVFLAEGDGSVKWVRGLRLGQPGIYRIRGREERLGLAAESNPLHVRAEGTGAGLALWGDLRGQSAETNGTGSAAEYFRYARDAAALDFCSLQGNAYQITRAFWQELQAVVRVHNAPGRFVALLGYQWAGNTAGGGARNVLFRADSAELRRCSRALVPDDDHDTDCFPLSALYEALRGQEALTIANGGSPAANLDYHDPELEPLIEVYSGWGEAPWLRQEALRRGYVVGFVASSADPCGRPGVGYPGAGERGAHGGLTCVYARERSRAAVWEALRARRCYGTTGARVLLGVEADGHAIGEVYRAEKPPQFRIQVSGTAEIERVEIHRGLEVAYRYPEQDGGQPGWIRVLWGGALARDWPRHVPWDGTVRVHGAHIEAVLPYGFDCPARGIVVANGEFVSFRSLTAGNENGLLLHLAAGPRAQVEFHAPLLYFTVGLADLPHERDLGGEGLHVRIEPRPLGTGQRDLELTWSEPALRPGVTPYSVIVRQTDGHRAWSSPIYVVGV